MGNVIVYYGSQKREVYSSNYFKYIGKEDRFPNYSEMLQRLIEDERVLAIECEGISFQNLNLSGRMPSNQKMELFFTYCHFQSDLTLENFPDVFFDHCDIGCLDSDVHLSANRAVIECSTLRFADATFKMGEELALLYSRTDSEASCLTLESPSLYFIDSQIRSYDLTWNVQNIRGVMRRQEVLANSVHYFGISVASMGTLDFGVWFNNRGKDERPQKLQSLMGIAKFLENKGYQLISQIQEVEVAKQYQEHLRGMDETNLKEVFSALEQPYSMTSNKELERETIPQLVKRLQREK